MTRIFRIVVPASSANLGPGFDSIGLALSFRLEIDVFPAETWSFLPRSPALAGVPEDETNLVIRTALDGAPALAALGHSGRSVALPPCRLEAWSDIPLARGLGSSAAAIVAGLLLANERGGYGLSRDLLAGPAVAAEGHPDNPLAALFGGLVVAGPWTRGPATNREDDALPASAPDFVRLDLPPCDIVVSIPDYPLETKKARAALPASLPHPVATAASAQANLLVAALGAGDWATAGRALMGDLLHEPCRRPLLPDFDRMRRVALDSGAYGATLSGAGPTVIAFAPPGRGLAVRESLAAAFPAFDTRLVSEDKEGARLIR